MRIGIVGAHGVGKTTLAKLLSDKLSLPIVPDTAAEAFKKGYAVNENTTIENQFWIISKQIEYEREFGDSFIADKTLYDNLVYGKYLFKDQDVLSVLHKIVLGNSSYDLLFYIPIEIPLVNDGRSIDPQFQKAIDEEFLNLAKSFKLKLYPVSGSVEERLVSSLKIINQHPASYTT